MPTGSAVIWNPIQSASPATTFSAFLSGIVLSAVVQLGIAQARQKRKDPESEIDLSSSIRFALVALATLATATYLFVLLAGLAPTTNTADSRSLAIAKAHVLFAIDGSLLAVGAILTFALILMIFIESGTARTVIDTVRTILVAGTGLVGILIVSGYHNTLETVAANIRYWWILAAIFVYVPGVLAFSVERVAAKVSTVLDRILSTGITTEATIGVKSLQRPALRATVWLVGIPLIGYEVVTHLIETVGPVPAVTVVLLSSLWTGLSLAAILVLATKKPSLARASQNHSES